MNLNNEKGITLVALVITIIILLIIAGIGINTGIDSIERVELEEIRTNMLLIQAKAREYVEEANFKIGKETDQTKIEEVRSQVYIINGKLEKANTQNVPKNPGNIDITNCYVVTKEVLNMWGLSKIELKENEKYLLKFDETNISVEIYNTKGYKGKYSLSEIERDN